MCAHHVVQYSRAQYWCCQFLIALSLSTPSSVSLCCCSIIQLEDQLGQAPNNRGPAAAQYSDAETAHAYETDSRGASAPPPPGASGPALPQSTAETDTLKHKASIQHTISAPTARSQPHALVPDSTACIKCLSHRLHLHLKSKPLYMVVCVYCLHQNF